ncbi:hypothetical protein [Thiocapsa imhoffii]|uniref:hypothetical protein n=1 Tax=Thiocapsa imhoffii TaxID=382777 RepID=UPI001F5B164D|nr:hypothetical protein [Thiocapsa imhoffii]
MSIRGIGELEVAKLGGAFRLLESGTIGRTLGLGLDHRDRKITGVEQNIIGALAIAANGLAGDDLDPPIREGLLLGDQMGRILPAGFAQSRRDEYPAGIRFVE